MLCLAQNDEILEGNGRFMEKYLQCLMVVALATSVFSGCLTFPGGNRDREPVVVLETNKGVIVLELYPEAAPKTVDNFKTLIQQKFYDSLTFHNTPY